MAARLWGFLLLLQLLVAISVAFALVGIESAWLTAVMTAVAFIVLQYLITALTIAMSHGLAGEGVPKRFVGALRVAFTEPVFFGMAQLSMILAGTTKSRAEASRPDGNDQVPLLLVHGLACNHGIWHWLIPRLRAAGFSSIHAVDLEPLRADIDSLARQLVREVRRLHREHGGSGVTIIGHSMGGLIARAALRRAAPQSIRQIITIATPHHGAAIARALSWLPAKQMCLASPWIVSLNAGQEGQFSVPLTSLYSVDDNLVAPAKSSCTRGATAREMSGLGHFGLLVAPRALDCVLRSLESES